MDPWSRYLGLGAGKGLNRPPDGGASSMPSWRAPLAPQAQGDASTRTWFGASAGSSSGLHHGLPGQGLPAGLPQVFGPQGSSPTMVAQSQTTAPGAVPKCGSGQCCGLVGNGPQGSTNVSMSPMQQSSQQFPNGNGPLSFSPSAYYGLPQGLPPGHPQGLHPGLLHGLGQVPHPGLHQGLPQGIPQLGQGGPVNPSMAMGGPSLASGPRNASSFIQQLNAGAPASSTAPMTSAFSVLGKDPTSTTPLQPPSNDLVVRALTAAITGDRKSMPQWSGQVELLRSWLRSLAFWELDNNTPKEKWGLKLMQAFPEGTPPRKLSETIEMSVLTAEAGYGAILSAIYTKYLPFLEAAAPASIDAFFFGTERNRSESFSTYVASKEIALQEMESHVGEKLPPKLAGRILLKHANLSDQQRENLAIKHNAMMTFDEVANALRPLDRPEALVNKVAKNFVTSYGNAEASNDGQGHGDDADAEEEMEIQNEEEEEDLPESDGEGNLVYLRFDPDKEYTEEEAMYIYAYNSAYKDVRRELQANRKGRQFFKNKGYGKKSKQVIKGKKGHHKGQQRGNRMTPEDLQNKTRCFKCNQLGHISRDCPERAKQNFFVCMGQAGTMNRIYMTANNAIADYEASYGFGINEELMKKVAVYAGVSTESYEAIVDTAAEEAVIGSRAMTRLRQHLARFGLQLVQASGASVSCAGIGGAAKIAGIYDVPLGVAKTNGLIRVTEILDEGNFETPFLLPISYQEVVGATINVDKNLFILKNGKKTPMRRLPTGHRAISILEFQGKWRLPDQLRDELQLRDDPFSLDTAHMPAGVRQRPGVAVWLKNDDGQLQYMGTLAGPHQSLVDPREVLPPHVVSTLSRKRTTYLNFTNHDFQTINDFWDITQQRQLPFWAGDVIFERDFHHASPVFGAASTPTRSSQASSSALRHGEQSVGPLSQCQKPEKSVRFRSDGHESLQSESVCEYFDLASSAHLREPAADLSSQALRHQAQPGDAVANQPMVGISGGRRDTSPKEDGQDQGSGRLEANVPDDPQHDRQHHAAECSGLLDRAQRDHGHPQGKEPCQGEEEGARKASHWKNPSWHWPAFAEINRLQDLAKRSFGMCSRRRSATTTGIEEPLLVDMLGMWLSMGKARMGARRGFEFGSTLFGRRSTRCQNGDGDNLQDSLPGAIASTEIKTGLGSNPDLQVATVDKPIDLHLHSDSKDSHSGALRRASAERGGAQLWHGGFTGDTEDSTADVSRSQTSTSPSSTKNPELSGSSGVLRDQLRGRPDKSRGLQDDPSLKRSSSRHHGSAKTALLTTVVVFCMMPDAAARFSWLGPRLETEDADGKNSFHHTFALNASLKELARTDFDGSPALLERTQWHFVTGQVKNYLDHVGEVYSPPRVTKEARLQGLRGDLALDLTTGWDFNISAQRQAAKDLINKKKPGVLLLSPPCRTFSPLRRLSNFKRNPWVVQDEEQEGTLHMDYAVSLAEDQMDQGRAFILEHPATSWKSKSLKRLCERPDVYTIYLDMCAFNLRATKGPAAGRLARKSTVLATNIPEIADYVERSCNKKHLHGPLIGGAAQQAAVYTPEFVKALLEGIKESLGFKSMSREQRHVPPRGAGRAIGSIAYEFALESRRVDAEMDMIEKKNNNSLPGDLPILAAESAASQKAQIFGKFRECGPKFLEKLEISGNPNPSGKLGSFPVAFVEDAVALPQPQPEGEAQDPDAEALVRAQLRDVGAQPRIASALERVEDFQKMDAGQFTLAPQLRREVHRVHRNLGHPSKEIFIRALRHAGVRDDIIDWAKAHYRCPICEARQRPLPARPGHLMRALEFNMVIGIDLFFLDVFNKTYTFLNMLCWGTNFQQVALCKDKSSLEVLNTFYNEWVKHYGVPVLLIADRGREFFGQKFHESVGSLGTGIHFTDPESPWQNSRTEKAGGVLKEKLMATISEVAATAEELPMVLGEVVATRNRFMDRYGFSPMQRVFGKNLRLPASILSTDALDRELVDLSANEQIQRLWEIREAASKEWVKRQDQEAVRRSVRARTRMADLKDIKPGTWVYVYRDSPSYKGWTGPGVFLADDSSNRSGWVSMRGRLWKVSKEQLRSATPEEELGAELVVELSKEMMDKLHQPGQIAYQDVTLESPPELDDFPADELVRMLQLQEEPRQQQLQLGDQPLQVPETAATESTHLGSEAEATESGTLGDTEPPSRRVSIAEEPPSAAPMETIEEEGLHGRDHERSRSPPGADPGEVHQEVQNQPDLGMPSRSPRKSAARASPYPYVPVLPPPGWRPTPSQPHPPYPYPFGGGMQSMPPPPKRSFYVEVINFDKDEDFTQMGINAAFVGANWKLDREQNRATLQPRYLSDQKTFTANQAEASFSVRDKCMYVTKAKTSFGQVDFEKLPEKEKVLFRQARKKELDSLTSNGAVKILSVEESREFLRQYPDQVIDSRFVDRYKPKEVDVNSLAAYKKKAIEEGHLEHSAKSRWCVVGWQDPQVMEVERSSPTPLSTSIYGCLQLSASRRWRTHIKDVKTAFLQGLPTTRRKKIACRQPRGEPIEGLLPEQLLLLLTEVYGLVSGPSWWRRSLLQILTEQMPYKICPYDRCVLTLPSQSTHPDAPTDGYIVIEVDDIAEAGNERHQQMMAQLHERLKFGKIVNLYESDGSTYAGRYINQTKDFGFDLNMEEFIYTRLEPIKPSRQVLKKDAANVKLNETEKTQLRGLIASLNWVSREGRPDASAAASILASAFPEPTMSHIHSANDVVAHLKTFPVTLRIHPIPEAKLRNLLIADAAFDTSGKEKSQHGWLLGYTDDTMNQGAVAPVSLMQWRSKRLRRKASSSLLCEAISMSAATGALERQDAFMASIRKSHFTPRMKQKSEDEFLELAGKATVIAEQSHQYRDPGSIAVMDAKALFDSINAEQPNGEDERSALEVAIIKESLIVTRGRPRWIPHNYNPADALTKLAAHMEPMLKLLSSGCFQIEEEDNVLEKGRQGQERLKVSMGKASRSNYNFWGLTD